MHSSHLNQLLEAMKNAIRTKFIGAHRQISQQIMLLSILLFLVFTSAGAFTAAAQIAVVPDQGVQSGHPFQLPFEMENTTSFPVHIQRVFL